MKNRTGVSGPLNGLNQSTLRAMQEEQCEAMECVGERPLMETVGITAERLQHTESRLRTLEGHLFGLWDPDDSDCEKTPRDMSVRYLAQDAFSTSVRIERLVEDLIRRTEAN
jgi:hypothetical protein